MVTFSVHPSKGAKDGAPEVVPERCGFDYALKDVRAFDMKGRAIDSEHVSRLLKAEALVVVTQPDHLIDAQHLQWFKEGVLHLVVPERPLAQWSLSETGQPDPGTANHH
jgi:hypothetical protein